MNTNLVEQFKAARRAGTPLVAIETPDPAATIAQLVTGLNGKNPPVLAWDLVAGLRAVNENGSKELGRIATDRAELAALSTNPTEMLSMLTKLTGDTIVFLHNAHRYLDNDGVMQAVWNLRDIFKQRLNTLVLLGPVMQLPIELQRDVIVLDEPLPNDAALLDIVNKAHESIAASTTGLKPLTAKQADVIVRAARGLSAFSAEQAIYMSASKQGIDAEGVWERKRKMIEQTKGLTVYAGGERFDDIGGIERIKEFGTRLFKGKKPPTAIVWIDEIEKAMAGTGGAGGTGDTSGTSQDQLGVLLGAMQDNNWAGQILLGPPGCAKSLFAKALGATHGVPTIKLDLGAMKGSLVGQSEQQIRSAIKVIQAVAGDGAYWIATCNALDSLKPELRRRFCDGLWFMDLPDAKERASIWSLLKKQFDVPASDPLPDDHDWTGADVRNVCSIASRLQIPLVEASSYITPVSKSDPKSIERLRNLAEGAFLSASHAGVYRSERRAAVTEARKLTFETTY